MTRKQLVRMMNKPDGTIFGIEFVKKNVELRKMTARRGVKSHWRTKGTKPTTHKIPKYVVVFDMQKGEYRNVNIETVKRVKTHGMVFNVV